jgi:spore maturation protein CgeB
MHKLSIVYIGPGGGTSLHRAEALRRLGHTVTMLDPWRLLPRNYPTQYWLVRTGALFLGAIIRRRVLAALGSATFDLAYVDSGQLLDVLLVRELKKRCAVVINYNLDDPYGLRDGRKWRLYLEAVPAYDLVVVVRDFNVGEAKAAGARRVLCVRRSADEMAHAPRRLSANDHNQWSSDVVFIGTWMPERGPFATSLVRRGVPLSIYGDRWHKAREWPTLRSHWRGPGLFNDDDYARAVQCGKVCLGLLSKGNRDLTTQRSFEIPHLGGVLCAERTSEHVELYRDKEEAVFWSTPEECAAICEELLLNDRWRTSIALKGRSRCLHNRTTNEAVLSEILSTAMSQD